MTSLRYFGHVTSPDGCDWLKSAANFLLSLDQTLLLPYTVISIQTDPKTRMESVQQSTQ